MYKNIKIIGFTLISFFLACSITYAKSGLNTEVNTNFNLPQIIRSIALIYTDDKLDPEVGKFLNYKPEVIWDDNAYVYLWGMNIKTDQPYQVGKEILEKLLEEDKLYNYEQHPLNVNFLEDYPIYKTPENDLLCKKHEKGCIEKILNSKASSNLFLTDYGFYKSRYLKFLNFSQFSQIAYTRMESVFPSFRTISNAQKIYQRPLHNKFLKSVKKC